MNRLILSAAIPALLLAACAGGPEPIDLDMATMPPPPHVMAQSTPPHMPADLTPAGVRAADDHLALEAVNGAEAMAFVAGENERSLAALTGDRRYEPFRRQAEAILTATDRIPSPSFLGDGIGNFWQDAANPKGVWRRTTLESYRSANPQWETMLDIDALSRAEGRDWVWKGADCLAPDETRCLISLSDGGKDAVVVREFDTSTGLWVEDGFILPEGKHRLEWLDRDTLLVATDFGSENGAPTLTESGYPFIVKSLRRGQTLAQATEVYRGDIGDGGYGVSPSVYRDKDGVVQAVLVSRPLDTFRSETWRLVDLRPVRLNLPERVSVHGVVGTALVFSVEEDWDQQHHATAGTLMAVSLDWLGRPKRSDDEIVVSSASPIVMRPGPRQSIKSVRVMDGRIVASVYDNVRGRLYSFRRFQTPPDASGWTAEQIAVPDNVSVSLGDSSKASGEFFYSVEGFLVPSTLNSQT